MYNNALTGTIPSEFSTFSNIKSLSVFGNKLNGPIPSELGLLTSLERLILHFNDFTGTMPAEICALRKGALFQLTANCAGDNPPVICEQPECCTVCF
jgi:hypothetical protein